MLEKGGIEKDCIEEDPTIKCIVENKMLTIGKNITYIPTTPFKENIKQYLEC